MPACEVVDVHVRLWEALAEGRLQEARAIHDRLLPLLNFEQLYGPLAYKEVLVRRGIIAYPGSREGNGRHLDQYDHAELDRTLANLASLLPSSLVER
jgi:dihydrodipicolinate synthase/N-acetylneuraminate lyase